MSDYSITIVHLFPDLLDLYGDKGNIECLHKRLKWRGVDVNIVNITNDCEDIDFSEADIVFLGGGYDREEALVLEKLKKHKSALQNYVENGGVMLAVCGGYGLLGKSLFLEKTNVEGLGVLDIQEEDAADRFIGDVVIECEGIKLKVVGFENHAGRMNIGNNTPLGRVVKGNGNDGRSGFEGVIYKNVTGTYLHGPLLPKNPELCDKILLAALQQKYPDFKNLAPVDDGLEILANEYITKRI